MPTTTRLRTARAATALLFLATVAFATPMASAKSPLLPGAGTRPGVVKRVAVIKTAVYDVVVYGGTPGGVIAAFTAARSGAKVVLIEQTKHVGGIVSNGLALTDIGDNSMIGGYAKAFFLRTEKAEKSPDGRYHFQPKTAELVLRAMLTDAKVSVVYGQRLPDRGGVTKVGTRISSIKMTSGLVFVGKVFIDASYTGDLMAASGVKYAVGRESTAQYQEAWAGVRPTQTLMAVPKGMRAVHMTTAPGAVGSADGRIQASNYRVCFSSNPLNQTPFLKPAGYDADDYALISTFLANTAESTGKAIDLSWVLNIGPLVNQKFDVNDYNAMSTALPGMNYGYPDGTAATRVSIEALHTAYTKGLFYYLRYDLRNPQPLRAQMAKYGLCKDEFTDNGNWPRQLYIREGRRMIGWYVMTQADIQTNFKKAGAIGVGSYRIDSHLVSRWVDSSGNLRVEGSTHAPSYSNYDIPYRVITPKPTEVTNLLVPVATSASHVAWMSMRMEPHFMIMGEAAGEAAVMALAIPGNKVQNISVKVLQARLLKHGAVLNSIARK